MREQIIDDVVAAKLPTLDQGSKRHTVGVLMVLVKLREIPVTKEEIEASIQRLGFQWIKERGYRRPRYVRIPAS